MQAFTKLSSIFVIPFAGVSLFMAPLGVLHGIYAKYFGISLTAIATVLLVSRLFDAINDPIIGYCSDRVRLHTGTRKQFVFIGGLLTAISCYFLYSPPADAGLVHYTVWSLMLYLAITLFDIPYTAWASELAHSAEQKKTIFSAKAFMAVLGGLLFYLIPMLPIFESQDITPETLKVTALVGLAILIPGVFIVLRWIPSPPVIASPEANRLSARQDLMAAMHGMRKNRPFLTVVITHLLLTMSASIWYGLIFIYVDSYLEMGDQFAKVFLVTMILALASIPLWNRVSRWIGKKRTCLIGAAMIIISYIYTGILNSGEASFIDLLILKTIQSYGFTAFTVLIPAMLSECIDYGTLKEGTERSASYFSIYLFTQKSMIAIGTATGLGIAGWFGYAPDSLENTASSIWGLTFAIAWLPVVFAAIAALVLSTLSLDEGKHAIIRRRLDSLTLRTIPKK